MLNNPFWNIFRKIDCLLVKFAQVEEYHETIQDEWGQKAPLQ